MNLQIGLLCFILKLDLVRRELRRALHLLISSVLLGSSHYLWPLEPLTDGGPADALFFFFNYFKKAAGNKCLIVRGEGRRW